VVPRVEAEVDAEAYARLGYRLVWTGYGAVSPGAKAKSLTVLGDALVFEDTAGVVSQLSPVSGESKWATAVGTPLTRFLGTVRDGRTIVVCSESEAFVLDAESGTLLGRQRFARVVNTAPAQVGPVLVFGTSSGEVLGHLLGSGFRAWGYAIGGTINATPRVLSGTAVGVVSQNGQVIIIDAGTGNATARTRIAGGVECELASSASMLYVSSADQSVYGVDLYGTSPRWRRRTDSVLRDTPVFVGGRVYAAVPTEGLLALDGTTGSQAWVSPGLTGSVVGSNKGRLLLWDGKTAFTLDEKTGEVLERAALPGVRDLVTDNLSGGNVYAVSPAGVVHKFEPR
jgi:outer membrane protein assembly factor BamB